jgi:hypothetical protein
MAKLLTVAPTTIALSANDEFKPADYPGLRGLETCSYHTISITGSGTATIAFEFLGSGVFQNAATGVSGDYDTYFGKGVTSIKVTETGGANSIDVAICSFEE